MTEVFIPNQVKIFQHKSFEVKTHSNRKTGFHYWTDGTHTIHDEKCLNCSKVIEFNEKCFYGHINKDKRIVIRKQDYGTICLSCGLKALSEITPSKLLNNFNHMQLNLESES